MKFLDLAKTRQSVRSFLNKPVEKEKLLYILESARVAPSAKNLQPWRFIVVQDKQILNKICTTYKRDWLKEAPVIIVICGDHNVSWKRPDEKDHCDIDTAIAIEHMVLAAAEQGLGTCWVCMFDAIACHKILNLSSHMEPIALLPIGSPANELAIRNPNRKSLEDIVSWDNGIIAK
jgi:nitroreductase